MKKASYSDLREKEVINCRTGQRLGFINDLEIDLECGRIISIQIVEYNRKCSLLGKEVCRAVCWENIQKIGDDLIIVDCEQPCEKTDKPKKFFL